MSFKFSEWYGPDELDGDELIANIEEALNANVLGDEDI